MSLLAGPLMALAVLVGWAGVLKLARPAPTAAALRTARLPGGAAAVRLLGASEIVLAAVVAAFGGRLAAAVVAAYFLAFAGFTVLLIRRSGAQASCGCFGEASAAAPASPLHVAMDLVGAGLALAAVVRPPGGLGDIVADQPLAGAPFLVLVGVLAALWYATITLVPALADAVARLSPGAEPAPVPVSTRVPIRPRPR